MGFLRRDCRFRTKLVGVESSYKLAASSVTPMVMLDGIMPGVTLEIIAQAVNGSSQGVASDPITVTMPLPVTAAKPETMADVELAPLAAILPNGNSTSNGNGHGNGNGNGNGSHAVRRRS